MHRRNNLNFTKYDLIKILLVAGITLLGYFCFDWYQSRPSHIIQHDYLDDTQYQEHLANSRVDDILAQLLAYLSEDETIFFVSPSKLKLLASVITTSTIFPISESSPVTLTNFIVSV